MGLVEAMNRFRPQDLPRSFVMRQRLKYGRTDNYTWQTRVEWFPVGYRINRKTISRQFGKLHYLACHAPGPVQQRWDKAYKLFYRRHFGADRGASIRYLNTWSAHSWL